MRLSLTAGIAVDFVEVHLDLCCLCVPGGCTGHRQGPVRQPCRSLQLDGAVWEGRGRVIFCPLFLPSLRIITMRSQCKGCGATIDLYQGVLDACPMCDTIHTFNAPAPKPCSISGGRTWMLTMSGIWLRRSTAPARGLRVPLPCRRQAISSLRSSPTGRAYTAL